MLIDISEDRRWRNVLDEPGRLGCELRDESFDGYFDSSRANGEGAPRIVLQQTFGLAQQVLMERSSSLASSSRKISARRASNTTRSGPQASPADRRRVSTLRHR